MLGPNSDLIVTLYIAVEGVDFVEVNEQVVFSAGETRECLQVQINEDPFVESDEPFPLTATGASLPPGVTVDPGTTMVTILNDDGELP